MQIDKLRSLPGIKDISGLPLVSSVLEVFLPSLVLRIFLVILPYLLDYMGHIQGLVSLSAVQFSVVKKLFAFQVFPIPWFFNITIYHRLPLIDPKDAFAHVLASLVNSPLGLVKISHQS